MAEKKKTTKKKADPKRKRKPKDSEAVLLERQRSVALEPKATERQRSVALEPKATERQGTDTAGVRLEPKGRLKGKAKKPKRKKKAIRTELARGKRKRAIARARVKEGSGRVRMNSVLSGRMENRYARELVEEPMRIAGPEALKVDVDVNVRGGGVMGQAQAARTAVARALAQFLGEGVKKRFEETDKYLLAEDPRRVEPKKYKGPKARARSQKSYR